MNDSKPCCRNLGIGHPATSPFEDEIAFGFYDGPTSGILRCGSCGREFCFDMIDSRSISEEDETRIFQLSPIPIGSVASFTAAMSAYEQPRRPSWVPLWSFPSPGDLEKMNTVVDRICDQAGPPEWVVAISSWLSGEILGARPINNSEPADQEDWFTSLGLAQASIDR